MSMFPDSQSSSLRYVEQKENLIHYLPVFFILSYLGRLPSLPVFHNCHAWFYREYPESEHDYSNY